MQSFFALCTNTLSSVALIFIGLVALSGSIFIGSLLRQMILTRRFLASLPIMEEGLAYRTFYASQPHVFCAGLFRQTIYVSTSARDSLSTVELAAVLAHEKHHIKKFDTLKTMLLVALRHALFFLPIMKHLVDRHTSSQELAADRDAMHLPNGRVHLAQALYKLSRAYTVSHTVSSFTAPSSLTRRIAAIAGQPQKRVPFAVARFIVSLGALACIAFISIPSSHAKMVTAPTPCLNNPAQQTIDPLRYQSPVIYGQ